MSFLMLEGTLCKIIIQLLIRFNSLRCRREFQTKSRVSSGFTNVSEEDHLEIDEKPELPNNVIVPNFRSVP